MRSPRPTGLAVLFFVFVVAISVLVLQRFMVPLVWAGVFCISTWPLHNWLIARLHGHTVLSATLLTAAIALVLAVPAFIGLEQGIIQAPAIAEFFAAANQHGLPPPAFLSHLPLIGDAIWRWWQQTLAQPQGLSHLLSMESSAYLRSASEMIRRYGSQLIHRLIDFGFALICLFFMYKNGRSLHRQIITVMGRWLGPARRTRYLIQVVTAIRATVNGLVLVGLAEGVLIGICYALVGLHSAALWGAAIAMLAIIPFGAPIAFLSAAGVLAASGSSGAAAAVVGWGSLVLFVADHFVRPNLIGNATRLPFLAVLFGILGGVETFGLVGLFIGPAVMALSVTLWREAAASNTPAPDHGMDGR